METILRILGVICFSVMWIVTPVAAAQSIPTTIAAVGEAEIHVSLAVYVMSIIGTAGFTWTIARYERAKDKKIQELETMVQQLIDRSE
jgi:hypothetical protein